MKTIEKIIGALAFVGCTIFGMLDGFASDIDKQDLGTDTCEQTNADDAYLQTDKNMESDVDLQ